MKKVIFFSKKAFAAEIHMTYLKEYEVIKYESQFEWYLIKNDKGDIWRYNTDYFTTKEELRDKKLKRLFNDI